MVCPFCEETGCDRCDNGFLRIAQCPQSLIGREMICDIQVVSQCTGGVLPVAGGLLNQTAYYLALKSTLEADENLIQAEKGTE